MGVKKVAFSSEDVMPADSFSCRSRMVHIVCIKSTRKQTSDTVVVVAVVIGGNLFVPGDYKNLKKITNKYEEKYKIAKKICISYSAFLKTSLNYMFYKA